MGAMQEAIPVTSDIEIKVLLVDDHEVFRELLSERLTREKDVRIVGVAENADEALTLAVRLQPAVILMDIDMPGLACFDAARQLKSRVPQANLIFLSAFLHDAYVEQALTVKARGYLTKQSSYDTVLRAVRIVALGGAFFSEDVEARIVVDAKGARLGQARRSRCSTLSPREIEVLRYIGHGLSKKQIASTMHLSDKTVDSHTSRLMGKLEIHNRVELARFAIREGLAEA